MSKILVVGGAGFIGSNIAASFLKGGHEVTILDNFSRKGSFPNVQWLKESFTRNGLRVIKADIRRLTKKLLKTVEEAEVIFHMASQVAVTTSVEDPKEDFEINLLGTFNLLEAMRKASPEAILIFASTNKVYGDLEELKVVERDSQYEFEGKPQGIDEHWPLDFHSPYGCSKGAADQYVRDYARIYGLKTVVFRQSCIYGPRQFGTLEQGWVCHFALQALHQRPITLYGTGKQVRDALFIDDLVEAYKKALEHISMASGQIYNIGGGREQCISLLQLISLLEEMIGQKMEVTYSPQRPGDQKVFFCDISKARRELGWEPRTPIKEGLKRLMAWLKENWRYC